MSNKNPVKFKSALMVAKGLNTLINTVAKGRGTGLPGEKALAIDPEMVAHFEGIDPEKVIFITGTNGKSTTTNLITHILRHNGKKVISNLEGANMLDGLATALSRASNMNGKVDADYFVFEVDERFMPIIYKQLPAKNMLIMNLMKDQVQRNGDPQFIVDKLHSVMHPDIRLFLNNHEPRSKGFERFTENAVFFDAEESNESFNKDESYPTQPCPVCNHKLEFDYYNTDSVGPFHCTHCGFSSCPKATYTVTDIDYDNKSFKYNGKEGTMNYVAPFMTYNYAGAIAVAKEFAGLTDEEILDALPSFENVGGRIESFDYKGKTVNYLRIKQENPDTLQNTLNLIAQDPNPKKLLLGLYPITDFVPHYVNSFYMYDCDWTKIKDSNVESFYCFSPAVCYDTARVLLDNGVDRDKITVEDTEDLDRLFEQIENAETDNLYLITVLDKYNEMKAYARKAQHEEEREERHAQRESRQAEKAKALTDDVTKEDK